MGQNKSYFLFILRDRGNKYFARRVCVWLFTRWHFGRMHWEPEKE